MAKAREVNRPKLKSDWQLRHVDNASEQGWRDLCAVQPGPCRTLYDKLLKDPTEVANPDKQHRLKGGLGTVEIAGNTLPQWQYELAKGARVWYAVEKQTKVVHLTLCSTGHPNETK